MGKILAEKIGGMDLRAKVALVVLCTLIASVFMYAGWYSPLYLQAATNTYNLQTDAATSLGADGTCNLTQTVAPTAKTTMVTPATTAGTSYRPTTGMTQGTSVVLVRAYGPTYASAQTISNPSGNFAIRGYNATDTWTFHIYDYDPAGSAGNKTLMFSSNTTTSGTGSTVAVSPTYTQVKNTIAAGHRLLVEIAYTPGGGTLSPRVYLDGTTTTTYSRITVTETAGIVNPTVTSTSPSSMTQGTGPTTVTITGTGFQSGATVAFSGTGVTTGTVTYVNSTTLTVPVTVAAGAATGARNVTVTNTDTGSGTGTGVFTVNGAIVNPTVTSTSPSSMVQGTGPTTVTITGTGFQSGATVAFSGTGITTGTVTYVNSTTLTVPVTVAAGAATGARNVTVTNTDTGSGTGTGVFTVNAAVVNPTVTSTSPSSMTQGSGPTTVTVTGTGFQSGATVAFSGTGVTTGTVTYVNSTTLTVPVTVAAGATTGARNVTVTNTDTGSGTGTGVFTVNAAACTAAAPSMTITPSSATVPAGGNKIYTVSVTNNDSAGCSATTFNLALANNNTANFASTALSTSSLNLAAGASNTATFTVTVNAGVADGTTNTSTVSMSGSTPTHTLAANVTAVTTVGASVSALMHTAANVNPTDTKGYGNWGTSFTCATCHTQGTTNVKLIETSVNTPNGPRSVVFTRMTATSNAQNGVFGNDARTYAGNGAGGSSNICEVCHRKTTFHRYSANAPTLTHYNNQLCMTCHSHAVGFKASGHTVPLYATAAGHTGCASGIGCHTNSNPAAPYPNAGSAPDCRSCHAKGDPTTAGIGCGSCHGASGGTGEPNGTAHPDAVGSHPKHVPLVAACTNCHDIGGTGGNADHGKGNRGTNPAVVNLAASFTWNGTTCSTASCHVSAYGTGYAVSPAWGTAGGCGSCHAINAATGAPATGSHDTHLAYTALVSCASCHAGAVKDSNGGTAHTDGNIDVTNGYPANVPKHAAGTYTGTCANTYCHSNGTSVATSTIPANTSPTWGQASDCTVCHSFPPAYANNSPKKNSHAAGGHSISCDNCHYNTTTNGTTVTTVANHVNSTYDVYPNTGKGIAFTYAYNSGGGTCSSVSCHGTAQWGVTVMDCVSCHTAQLDITKGPLAGQALKRRAIQPEFTQTWSHKASGGRTVVKEDCIVCHMEGNKASGGTSTVHGDGYVNLRDPDTGLEITNVTFSGTPGSFSPAAGNASFSRFTRDLGVPFESDPQFPTLAAIEINHCLKCHDSDGALDVNAQVPTTGTAVRPFGYAVGSTSSYPMYIAAGNGTSNVVDVKSSFSTANASYHPVLGKQNNGFINNSRLKAPWNGLTPNKSGTGSITQWGFLISCWDCHADSTDAWGNTTLQQSSVTAHGNSTTIRGQLFVGAGTNNFCLKCHADAYNGAGNHGTGSAFATGGDSSRYTIGNCQTCHGSFNNVRPFRGVDAHGFNRWASLRSDTTTPANSLTSLNSASGVRPYAFIRSNNLANVNPNTVSETWTPSGNKPGCVQGSSGCSNGHDVTGPGGSY